MDKIKEAIEALESEGFRDNVDFKVTSDEEGNITTTWLEEPEADDDRHFNDEDWQDYVAEFGISF